MPTIPGMLAAVRRSRDDAPALARLEREALKDIVKEKE